MTEEKAILVTGGTGFLGKPLAAELLSLGYTVVVLTRQAKLTSQLQDSVIYASRLSDIPEQINVIGVVNLAGESLNAKRWNEQQKKIIYNSRIDMTKSLVAWSNELNHKLDFFISGSAIGWYGHRQEEFLDENSTPGDGFAAQLCQDWEAISEKVNAHRILTVRTGIVLEEDGGPLKEMLLPFKLGVGGTMGDGNQVWSWIHRRDWVLAVLFLIARNDLSGAFNLTAPQAERQKVFAQTLAKILKRPSFMPMPKFIAKAVLGEFATEVLLNGQLVYPRRLIDAGFEFQHPILSDALTDIII